MDFYFLGQNTNIDMNLVSGSSMISLGNHVEIKGTLKASSRFKQEPKLFVGDRSFLNAYSGIEAYNKVEIGKYVLISTSVYITDGGHAYENIHTPIKYQGISAKGQIIIN